MYIKSNEIEALYDALDYVNNILEGCSADENSETIINLRDTLAGLFSLQGKAKNQIKYQNERKAVKVALKIIRSRSL